MVILIAWSICKSLVKEHLIKSNYFSLAITADIFHEDHRNRMAIMTHFEKKTDKNNSDFL